MKIGIATFNNALSYGAMLQAYALKTTLVNLGHEVNILNYSSNGNMPILNFHDLLHNTKSKKFSIKNNLRVVYFSFFMRRNYQRKIRKFIEFKNNYLNITDSVSSNILEHFDLIICGSDQIWNPEITAGFFDPFFGINNLGIPSISYAASVGSIDLIEKYEKNVFINNLQHLSAISCREESLTQYLNDNHISAETVLDPSFLLTKENYKNLLNKFDKNKKKKDYLLVFQLGKNKKVIETAKYIAKQKQLKIITFFGSNPPLLSTKSKFGDKSPIDFLSLIQNASYVITDSFHGLAFSIIFQKDFNVIAPKKGISRLNNILSLLNLKNRLVNNVQDLISDTIDYVNVEKLLDIERNKSINYLIRSINKIK